MLKFSIEEVMQMFPNADVEAVYMFHEFIYNFYGASDKDTDRIFIDMLWELYNKAGEVEELE